MISSRRNVDGALMEKLAALARFASDFANPTFRFSAPAGENDVYETLTPKAQAFIDTVNETGWISPFDWATWAQTDEGRKFLEAPCSIAAATAEELGKVLTVLIRGDRFSEGTISAAFESGLLLAIARRAGALLDEQRAKAAPEGGQDETNSPEVLGPAKRRMDRPEGGSSTMLGAAGEHYVMCQLMRRNMIAALAPSGVPDANIIVSDRLGSALAAIQVKTRRALGSDGGWHMKAKHESMARPLLFYCFIDFGRSLQDQPRCWVVPSTIVAEVLRTSHSKWLAKPGSKGKPHNDHDMRRFLPDYSQFGMNDHQAGWLDPYLEAWPLVAELTGCDVA